MTGAPLLQTAVAVTVSEGAKAVCATSPWKAKAATPVRNRDAARLGTACLNRQLLKRDFIVIFLVLSSNHLVRMILNVFEPWRGPTQGCCQAEKCAVTAASCARDVRRERLPTPQLR